MNVNFHNPQRAISNEMTCASGDFTLLQFSKPGDEVTLFLTVGQADMAHAIAAIFNGDLPVLVSRIEDAIAAFFNGDLDEFADRICDAMNNICDISKPVNDIALAIACDLIGKDLSEALRERREAEDAA